MEAKWINDWRMNWQNSGRHTQENTTVYKMSARRVSMKGKVKPEKTSVLNIITDKRCLKIGKTGNVEDDVSANVIIKDTVPLYYSTLYTMLSAK